MHRVSIFILGLDLAITWPVDLHAMAIWTAELSALIANSRPRTVAPPISFHRPVSWGARRVETREQKKFNYSRNGDDVCAEVGRTRSTPIYLRSPMPDARIVFLKSLPIPDNPNYQHPLQNPNLKAAIALYESGDLDGPHYWWESSQQDDEIFIAFLAKVRW